jgi:hypothetical protein
MVRATVMQPAQQKLRHCPACSKRHGCGGKSSPQ